MKTVTVRDLRQRWPKTEKSLQTEQELVITRDGRPVARLLRVLERKSRPRRWDPAAHKKWLKEFWGGRMFPSADAALARERADRWEKGLD